MRSAERARTSRASRCSPARSSIPVASGAPLLDVADWAGKTVEYAPGSNEDSVAALTIQTLGGTPSADGTSPVADLVAGSVQVATASPADLVAGGATEAGPFLTSNVPLWPKMSAIVINRDVLRPPVDPAARIRRGCGRARPGPGDGRPGHRRGAQRGLRRRRALRNGIGGSGGGAATRPCSRSTTSSPRTRTRRSSSKRSRKRSTATSASARSRSPKACRWVAPKPPDPRPNHGPRPVVSGSSEQRRRRNGDVARRTPGSRAGRLAMECRHERNGSLRQEKR